MRSISGISNGSGFKVFELFKDYRIVGIMRFKKTKWEYDFLHGDDSYILESIGYVWVSSG